MLNKNLFNDELFDEDSSLVPKSYCKYKEKELLKNKKENTTFAANSNILSI